MRSSCMRFDQMRFVQLEFVLVSEVFPPDTRRHRAEAAAGGEEGRMRRGGVMASHASMGNSGSMLPTRYEWLLHRGDVARG